MEEEYCLIPMGGVLPRRDQRVIGIGGTAGMVHPSTGYMVARMLGAVPQLADRVVDEVSSFKQHGDSRGVRLPLPSHASGAPHGNADCFLLATLRHLSKGSGVRVGAAVPSLGRAPSPSCALQAALPSLRQQCTAVAR